MEGMIILTEVTGKAQDINNVTGDSRRYVPQARIVAFDPDKPEGRLRLLTEGYYSALSPEISYDGQSMIFAAQQTQKDPWQIWEMNLHNLKIRKITSSPENCIDPAYLPGGRLIFSKLTINESVTEGHMLFTCNLDGSDLKQITFNPDSYFASTIMKDGRVLTISRQLIPEEKDPVLMVMRPDGTKADMFYIANNNCTLLSGGRETVNGKIAFIESDKDDLEVGNLVSITYNRPLHSRVDMAPEINGSFNSAFPMESGRLLVSYRSSENERYSIYEFDPETMDLGEVVYKNTGFDVLDALVVGKHERPKKLPSEVDMGVKTGLLLCQDINVLDMHSAGNTSAFPKAHKIEVIGRDSTMGVVQVEEDGSFYLKVIADTPFKIQTIDQNGRILHGPSGWIWLRPNERRGCVGCHEDPELAPDNRIPLSVKKPPVAIPVHVEKVIEKEISLE